MEIKSITEAMLNVKESAVKMLVNCQEWPSDEVLELKVRALYDVFGLSVGYSEAFTPIIEQLIEEISVIAVRKRNL